LEQIKIKKFQKFQPEQMEHFRNNRILKSSNIKKLTFNELHQKKGLEHLEQNFSGIQKLLKINTIMKITIESTTKIVELNGIRTRVWEGKSENGTKVHAFIARVAIPIDGHQEEKTSQNKDMSYKIKELHPDEPWEETVKYIESKRDWNVEKQEYRLSDKELKRHNNANLNDCEIYWRGKYLILEYDGIIHYWDSFPYCFFKQAVEFMELEKPAKWKTLKKLISLRMGIRQTEVNACGYVDTILENERMTLSLYQKFMRFARAHDLRHHGSHTF